MTLAEFLLARIAEDEAAANEAVGNQWLAFPVGEDTYVLDELDEYIIGVLDSAGGLEGGATEVDAAHIARWDPARVLAECEAKWLIATYHGSEMLTACQEDGLRFPCRTLRALAKPYADHPDYLAEWKP